MGLMRTVDARRRARWRHALLGVCVLGALAAVAALAEHHAVTVDMTAVGRNSLGPRSSSLLASLDGPVDVIVFAREERLPRAAASELLDRYVRVHPRFHYRFVDPDAAPDLLRRYGARGAGDLVVRYGGRHETLRQRSEAALTAAIERLARPGERWIAFLEGHGERDPNGSRNFDLGRFGAVLAERGYRVRKLDLAATEAVPDNTALLVLADPRIALPPGTEQRVIDFLAAGGSVLWLADPDSGYAGGALGRWLGVQPLPGHIEDAVAAASFGLDDGRFLVVGRYPPHALTESLDVQTLFVGATGLAADDGTGGFTAEQVLVTTARAELVDAGRRAPVPAAGQPFGLALTRAGVEGGEQRVVVLGDADFLANAYLGNGGNLQLGLGAVRWLTGADALVGVSAREAPDLRFEVSRTTMLVIAFGSLFGMPLLLAGTGVAIWFVRRRR